VWRGDVLIYFLGRNLKIISSKEVIPSKDKSFPIQNRVSLSSQSASNAKINIAYIQKFNFVAEVS
jgi:hypothetical protein